MIALIELIQMLLRVCGLWQIEVGLVPLIAGIYFLHLRVSFFLLKFLRGARGHGNVKGRVLQCVPALPQHVVA